jgi:cytochrome P450
MRGIRAETGRMYPLFKAWREGFSGRFEEAEMRITEYSKNVVVNAHGYNLEKSNIFTDMLNPSGKQREEISSNDAIMEAGALVVAGSGTTAVTLTYLIWVVLANPQVQKKLEEEVGRLEDGYADEQLEKLPYLNAVIEESLRLYGSAPGSLPRTVPKEGMELEGYYIPPGYTVETQAYTIHRDERLYHDPDRYVVAPYVGSRRSIADTAFQASCLNAGYRPKTQKP